MCNIFHLLLASPLIVAAQISDVWAQQKFSCTTVTTEAIVEAEAGISVGIFGNPNTAKCTFYVKKGPGPGEPGTPQQKATKLAWDLWSKPDEAMLAKDFVPTLQTALIEPIKAGQLDPETVEKIQTAFQEQDKLLVECARGAFFDKLVFQSYGDALSCGVLKSGDYFAVEAKAANFISALYLPLH